VKLIAKGKGIEVNTSGLFAPVKKTQPDEGVLRLYKGLGGKIVTIGSDSHQKENIGRGIEQAQELLRRVGFEYVTVYEDRTPRFVKI
jgi:histidinol-phosphatase (PHP family)